MADHPMTRPPPTITHPDPEAEKKYSSSFYSSQSYGSYNGRGSDHYYRERPGHKGEWATFSDSNLDKRHDTNTNRDSRDFWDMDSSYWEGDEFRHSIHDAEAEDDTLFDPSQYDREADGTWDDEDSAAVFGPDDLDTIKNPVTVSEVLPLEPPKVLKAPFEGLPILGVGLVVQSAVEACHAFDSYSYVHLLPINKVEEGFDVEIECERGARFIAYGRFVPGGCVIHRITQLAGFRDGEPY